MVSPVNGFVNFVLVDHAQMEANSELQRSICGFCQEVLLNNQDHPLVVAHDGLHHHHYDCLQAWLVRFPHCPLCHRVAQIQILGQQQIPQEQIPQVNGLSEAASELPEDIIDHAAQIQVPRVVSVHLTDDQIFDAVLAYADAFAQQMGDEHSWSEHIAPRREDIKGELATIIRNFGGDILLAIDDMQ